MIYHQIYSFLYHIVFQNTKIVLSPTDIEYISLLHSMRDPVPLINLLNKLNYVLLSSEENVKIYCAIFEDNNGYIELVKFRNMIPCTKHIGLKYHRFRSKVKEDLIYV